MWHTWSVWDAYSVAEEQGPSPGHEREGENRWESRENRGSGCKSLNGTDNLFSSVQFRQECKSLSSLMRTSASKERPKAYDEP